MPIPRVQVGATERVEYKGTDRNGNEWTGEIVFKRLGHGATMQIMADVAATRQDPELQAKGAEAVWRAMCDALARGIQSIDGESANLGQLLDTLDDANVVNTIQNHLLRMNALTSDMAKNSDGSPDGFLSPVGALNATVAPTNADASKTDAVSEAAPKDSPNMSGT